MLYIGSCSEVYRSLMGSEFRCDRHVPGASCPRPALGEGSCSLDLSKRQACCRPLQLPEPALAAACCI